MSGRVEVFGDECVDRERGLDLLVVRAAERVEALGFDLDLVMGSSEVSCVNRMSLSPSPNPNEATHRNVTVMSRSALLRMNSMSGARVKCQSPVSLE